jgi:hypothetical protein
VFKKKRGWTAFINESMSTKHVLKKSPNQKSRIASIPTRADRHGYARLNAISKTINYEHKN